MNKGRILTVIFSGLIAISSWAKPSPTLLSIKETITDNSIVYPESFETNTKEMMQNWYIQNYTVLDEDVEKKSSNDATDEEYIKRLKSMPTVIEMPYNQIVRKYIEMYVQKRRTLVETMLGMSLYYMPIFEQALEKERMPLELKYLPVIESALNPEAVSRVGATGLWQFMLGTAKGLGLDVNSLVDERRDPYRSSEAAAKYIKQLYNIYNDWSLAIAAYNCGPNNVNKALRRAGGDTKDFWEIYPYLPKETRGYVPAFIAANYVMTYFKYHNISPSLAKKPIVTDTVSVNKRINLNQIAGVLNMSMDELRVLNPQFRHDVIPGDSHPYSLALPSHQIYCFIMSEDSIANYRLDIYGRREVVEPATARYETNNSGEYTYETRLVTKSHKVGRGETLSSIARRYGTTTSTLKKANGLRRSHVQRGQVLRIKTYERVRVRKYDNQENVEPEENQQELANNGSTQNSEEVVVDNNENGGEEVVEETETVTNSPYAGSHRIKTEKASKSYKSKSSTKEDNSTQKEEKATTSKKNKNSKAVEEESASTKSSKRDKSSKATEEETRSKSSKNSKNSKATEEESTSSKKSKNSKNSVKEEETTSKKSKSSKSQSDEEDVKSSKKSNSSKSESREERSSRKSKTKSSRTSTHSVKEGESLYKIAEKHGVTVDELRKANNIKSSTLQPGQKIKVPKKSRR